LVRKLVRRQTESIPEGTKDKISASAVDVAPLFSELHFCDLRSWQSNVFHGSITLFLGVPSAKTKFRMDQSISAHGSAILFVSASATSFDNPQADSFSQSGHRVVEFTPSDHTHQWPVRDAEYFSYSNIASILTNKQLRLVPCSCQKLYNFRHL
jgi:hypothetical protein